jgi:hypothetical protein
LSTLLNASLTALSKHEPTRPMDCSSPLGSAYVVESGARSARIERREADGLPLL